MIANFANEHAPYAIEALNHGIHVFSENLPTKTMAEAVALCEAVEKSGKIYAYGAKHWRNFVPSTFYCTHSIGPILYVTGRRAETVVGMETQRISYMAQVGRAKRKCSGGDDAAG